MGYDVIKVAESGTLNPFGGSKWWGSTYLIKKEVRCHVHGRI